MANEGYNVGEFGKPGGVHGVRSRPDEKGLREIELGEPVKTCRANGKRSYQITIPGSTTVEQAKPRRDQRWDKIVHLVLKKT